MTKTKPKTNTKFARLVAEARIRGAVVLSLTELAALCQVTRYHLWRMIVDGAVPTSPTRGKLAAGMRVTRAALDACWE